MSKLLKMITDIFIEYSSAYFLFVALQQVYNNYKKIFNISIKTYDIMQELW